MATLDVSKADTGVRLEVDALIQAAERQTGLTDFGDIWFMEPLRALTDFVNREAGLTSDQAPPVRRMVDMLADRLELVDYLKRNPEVTDEVVDVAGIIVAHARGGSTLTQRLMGRSPQLTATYFWELHKPVPLRDEVRGDHRRRIQIGNDEVAAWAEAMPEYQSFHPHSAEYHEEDLVLGDRGFLSYMWSAQFNIPSYHAWMAAQDETRAYQEFKLWLQVLQHASPERAGKKWILKSVHHFVGCNLRTMFKTFPGATAIMTHRPMYEVIPSLSDVQSTHLMQSGSATFDRRQMGQRLIDQYVPAFADMEAVRREMPAERFIDVRYRDLVTQPIEQFVRILEGMGLTATDADVEAASSWMAQNGRGTHPPHAYAPEDFGVTRDQLAQTFKVYHEKYLG